MDANEYLGRMYTAVGTKLIDGHPIYSGRKGHLRLAREIGAALRDFTPDSQKTILAASYSVVYVRACSLRPTLNAGEWIAEMMKEDALCAISANRYYE